MIALLVTLTLFFIGCWIWSDGITLVSCFFLVPSNLRCAQSMCVFIGITPLHLLYFISPFLIIEQFSIKTFSLAYLDLQIMHLNICGFTMSTRRLSLTTKKTPTNGWVMVKLPQCNLSFYSCKLHNLYYCCHMTRCQITNFHVLNI